MKAIAMVGGLMFLIGISCSSIGWAAILVIGGGAMCVIGNVEVEA